jgi:HAD superfamily hydrolase (TIGR01459 family)
MKSLSIRFPIWFCDIWGVLHNGYQPIAATTTTLAEHRKAGGMVILVTNSPRTASGVASQITEIGVPQNVYDAIVTSGDVTRELMVRLGGGKLFHLGPARDLSIFGGLEVVRVGLPEATAVVCTGLFDDDVETPDDYADMLVDMKARNLLMICANPDKIVRRGDRILFCAGAIAEAYAKLGGKVALAGKPFTPIYDLAMATAAKLKGRAVTKSEVMAIGDGPETDIQGAADYGLPVVLVADGVTDASKGLAHAQATVQTQVPLAQILQTVAHLAWT